MRYQWVVICINGKQEIRNTFTTAKLATAYNRTMYGGDARIEQVAVPEAALLQARAPSVPAITDNRSNPDHQQLAMATRLWH